MVTKLDVYPLPHTFDFAGKAASCTAFSKIDLQKGGHQIPVNSEAVQKNAITTPFGLFKYKRMPYGLRNAGPSFQWYVDRAIRDCQAAFAWVDKIVICSNNHEEHVAVPTGPTGQWAHHNGNKCVWGIPVLAYLGHKISTAGVLPLPSLVATIQEFPCPSLIKELQAFLGTVNFSRRFLDSEQQQEGVGAAAMDTAFAAAKQALLSTTGASEISATCWIAAFHCFMYHKPLSYVMSRVSNPWMAHKCRHLSYVAEFTSDITAAASVEADTLCGPPGHVSAGEPSSAVTCVKVPGGPRLPSCREAVKLIPNFTS